MRLRRRARCIATMRSCHREPVGVVHEAVENGVGERRVADNLGTIARPEPRAGDDRRSALMTVFEDLEEVALLRLGKDRETQSSKIRSWTRARALSRRP